MSLEKHRPRYVLWLLCLGTFIGALNGNIFSPILPEISQDIGVSIPLLGQVVTASALSGLVLTLVAGPLSDIYGRRRLMVIGGAVLVVSNLATAVSPDFLALLLVRLVGGLGSALLIPSAMATAGDYFEGEARSRAVGLIVAFSGISTVIGWPAIGFITEQVGWRLNFVILAIFFALATIAVRIVLLPHRPQEPGAPLSPGRLWQAYREVLRLPYVLPAVLAMVLATGAWFAFITYIGAFYDQVYGLPPAELSLVLAVLGIAYFVFGAVNGPIAKVLGDRNQALVTSVLSGVVIIPFVLTRTLLPLSLIFLIVVAGMRALNLSSFQTLMLGLAPEHRGTILAVTSALFQVGVMAGAGLGGAAIQTGGALVGDGYLAFGILILGLATASSGLVLFGVPSQPQSVEAPASS